MSFYLLKLYSVVLLHTVPIPEVCNARHCPVVPGTRADPVHCGTAAVTCLTAAREYTLPLSLLSNRQHLHTTAP